MVEVIEILEKYKTVNGFNTKVIAKSGDNTFNYLFIKNTDVKIEVGKAISLPLHKSSN